MIRLLREPLLHFLLLGGVLFAAYGYRHTDDAQEDQKTIVVTRNGLLTFLQYRFNLFDEPRVARMLDDLPSGELDRVVNEYVREEALYREAKALRLEATDYVTRRRLTQLLEFTTRGFIEKSAHPTLAEIERFYEAHAEDYRLAPRITFAHVFFSSERRGAQGAEASARAALRMLNARSVAFDQGPAYGDKFLYEAYFVDRRLEEITDLFGVQMQEQLFALQPSTTGWRGPFRSDHGFHLVLLIGHQDGYLPSLEAVKQQVARDAREAQLRAALTDSIQSIVNSYEVRIDALRIADGPVSH